MLYAHPDLTQGQKLKLVSNCPFSKIFSIFKWFNRWYMHPEYLSGFTCCSRVYVRAMQWGIFLPITYRNFHRELAFHCSLLHPSYLLTFLPFVNSAILWQKSPFLASVKVLSCCKENAVVISCSCLPLKFKTRPTF